VVVAEAVKLVLVILLWMVVLAVAAAAADKEMVDLEELLLELLEELQMEHLHRWDGVILEDLQAHHLEVMLAVAEVVLVVPDNRHQEQEQLVMVEMVYLFQSVVLQ